MLFVNPEEYERIKKDKCFEDFLDRIMPNNIFIYTATDIARMVGTHNSRIYQRYEEMRKLKLAMPVNGVKKFRKEAVDYIGTKIEGTVGRPRKRGG